MDEPCAYAIFENREPRTVTFLREQAEVWMAGNEKCTAVPLYRHPQPTLTDAEREAVEASMHGENDATVIATLRKLLARLT